MGLTAKPGQRQCGSCGFWYDPDVVECGWCHTLLTGATTPSRPVTESSTNEDDESSDVLHTEGEER